MPDNRKRAFLFGFLALLLAFFTIRAVSQRFEGEELIPVVVAREAIPAGSELTADMLQVTQRPQRYYGLESYFATLDEVVGQTALVSVAAGDVIRAEGLDPDGCPIPEGMVVMTVSSAQAIFPSRMIDCESTVDIYFAQQGEDRSEHTILFAENILLLSGCARLPGAEPAANSDGKILCNTIELLIPSEKQGEWANQIIFGEGIVLALRSPATPGDGQAVAFPAPPVAGAALQGENDEP
jgi:Flp pilus assembly protein CpaB